MVANLRGNPTRISHYTRTANDCQRAKASMSPLRNPRSNWQLNTELKASGVIVGSARWNSHPQGCGHLNDEGRSMKDEPDFRHLNRRHAKSQRTTGREPRRTRRARRRFKPRMTRMVTDVL